MGYYIRILSTSAECVHFATLRQAVAGFKCSLSVETGEESNWQQLVLTHADGREIASIERNLVTDSSLGAEELDEFREELAHAEPKSGAGWLVKYFEGVRCIYACQLLSGTDHLNGWEIFGAFKNALWSFAPSIIQADGEGFTNEDGNHVVWQFGDHVSGPWWMGLLRDGQWTHFQMELGDRQQRDAFLRGEVPAGARMA